MNLQDTWNELQQSAFSVHVVEEDGLESLIHAKSISPLAKLRRQVSIKMGFIVFFILLFLGVMPFIQQSIVQILLLVLTLVYVIGLVLLMQERKELQGEMPRDSSLLNALKHYEKRISSILHYEELIGLFLYPVSATLGFLWAFTQEKGIEELFQNTWAWMTLVISLVILTPLCHWLARWMNQIAFGKYLQQVRDNIAELESQE